MPPASTAAVEADSEGCERCAELLAVQELLVCVLEVTRQGAERARRARDHDLTARTMAGEALELAGTLGRIAEGQREGLDELRATWEALELTREVDQATSPERVLLGALLQALKAGVVPPERVATIAGAIVTGDLDLGQAVRALRAAS